MYAMRSIYVILLVDVSVVCRVLGDFGFLMCAHVNCVWLCFLHIHKIRAFVLYSFIIYLLFGMLLSSMFVIFII